MSWQPYVAGIVPSIGVGLIFWYAMRAVLRADRNERAAVAAADAAYDAQQLAIAATNNDDAGAPARDAE